MNDKTKTGLEILQASTVLGITGDLLLKETPWGLNVFLWIGLLVLAMIGITIRRKSEIFSSQTIVLHGALIFLSLMFVWRDSAELKVLNFLGIITVLAILVLPALNIKTHLSGVFQYIIGLMFAVLSAFFSPFVLLVDDIKWKSIPKKGWTKHLISVVRGLAIAFPILLVFGALFMAADAVFEGIVQNTFSIDPDIFIGHLFLIGLLTWLVAGYLRVAILGGIANISAFTNNLSPAQTPNAPAKSVTASSSQASLKGSQQQTSTVSSVTNVHSQPITNSQKTTVNKKNKSWDWRSFDNKVLPNAFTLGLIETSIILGLVNLLFFAFVIVQVPYLFGGMDLVQATPDFKLAEYARRGFGELVLVSALVLPILLLSHWLLRKDKPINEKVYRVLAGIQIALLFVIMISATQRLLLLTGNVGYGLTTVRFYPMVFMIFLALVFAWFAMTVLRGARNQFAWGTLWLAFFMIGILHVMNPDDFIVRTNIQLMQQGRAFDADYNATLSDDAIPAIVESMELMNYKQKCITKLHLNGRSNLSIDEQDFRSWNYSRWRAKVILWGDIDITNTEGCPPLYSERYYK